MPSPATRASCACSIWSGSISTIAACTSTASPMTRTAGCNHTTRVSSVAISVAPFAGGGNRASVVDIYLLRNAIWTPFTRIAKVFIEAAGIVLTFLILSTPNIIGFTAESFANIPESSVDAQTLMTVFNLSFPITMIIIIIIQGVELAKAIYGLFKTTYKAK